ncbi:MAG TPA: S4 domain-containing protein, partial [Anaerolineales bacterium]|nr:S4 domain-containing protein [Anaerolineales bacterium]
MPADKVQKLMAQAGLGSRRACEQTIRQGRVSVNGQVVRLGERADLQTDEVRVDGVPLRSSEPLTYIALHKPPGVLSSSQSQGGHPTVIELVGSERRLYPVGRLDLESEGLMLLTNDGELA